jgi:hypothetical protein
VKAAPADNPDIAGQYSLFSVSPGRHACFDRLVLDFTGPMSGYSVDYVELAFTQPGGDVAGVRGGARLEIIAGASTSRFEPENPRESSRSVAGAPFVRWSIPARSRDRASSASACGPACPSGPLCWPAGPADGSRLVVDVAHRW